MSQRDINNIDKTILDNFYKLVHSQPHVRITAASSTFKILDGFKKKTPVKFNDNLNYCVDRLVAGLASSRAMARQGYAILLLELLKSFQISTERLFTVANDKFGHVTRETSGDNLIGYFLLVSIVLKSENYKKSKANLKYEEKIYKILMQLLTKKSYMSCPVTRILMDYYEVFSDYLLEFTTPETALSSPAEIIMLAVTGEENSTAKLSRVLEFSRSIDQNTKNVFVKNIIDMLRKALDQDETAPPKIREAAIRQIIDLVRRPQMVEEHEFIADVARTFFVNYLCKSRSQFKKPYHSILDHLVSTCNVSHRIQHLRSIINCYQTKNPELDHIKQVTEVSLDEKQLYPITTLRLLYGLQIIEHGLKCKSQLDELTQAAEDALKGDPNDGSWADILTDQILAIISATECKTWVRKLCSSVFGSLLPHISVTSIELICDALKSGDDDEDVDDDGVDADDSVEDEDEDEDHDVEDEEVADEQEIMDEDDEQESAEEVMGMDCSEPDPIGRDDSEEEYLDDERMLQLDSHLVEMFKLKRKSKGEPAFKLRCLDLVEKIVIKKPNDTETIETILATIIPMAKKSGQTKKRVTKMLAKMKNKSKYPKLKNFLT